MKIDRSRVMREAHKNYKDSLRLDSGLSFSRCLRWAWTAAKMRRDNPRERYNPEVIQVSTSQERSTMKNQALICEQALTSVGAVGDLVTSPLLVELAEVESANASAYLKAQTSKGRLELIGKTVHTEGKKKVYVYRVKEEFFKIPARSKCAELNFARCGGAKGRTWETQDLPEIFI